MKDKIAIKRVKLRHAPDFIYSVEEWEAHGGYKGFISNNCMSIKDIERVEDGFMDRYEFNSMPAWEG